MSFVAVNYLAVLSAAIAGFMLGGLSGAYGFWQTRLFVFDE